MWQQSVHIGTGGDSSQWKGREGVAIQLLRPKASEVFWISLSPSPPHLFHWQIPLASCSKHIQGLTTSQYPQHYHPCPSHGHLLPGPPPQHPTWSPHIEPCLPSLAPTQEPNLSFKSRNQNTPTTLSLNTQWFSSALKIQTLYRGPLIWLPPTPPTSFSTLTCHIPTTLVFFLFLEPFQLLPTSGPLH